MSKKSYAALFFLFVFGGFFCSAEKNAFVSREIDLAEESPSQVSVLGGNVLCQPVRTSYGYVAAGDSKQIYGFSPDGKLLWQRSFIGRLKKFISAAWSDMVLAVTEDSRLGLMNSSGLVLWSAECGFSVEEPPLCGADGRIFVRGKNDLACYGIKGVRRWRISTEDQDVSLPAAIFNDSSILIFLSRTENGKSVAKRFDIFGEEKEEIVFSGKVSALSECTQGILLAFTDGSLGLCASSAGGAYSKWTSNSELTGISAITGLSADPSSSQAAVITKSRIHYFDTSNGREKSSFPVKSEFSSVTQFFHTAQGLVLSDGKRAGCFQKDGSVSWSIKFNPQKKWNFFYATDSGDAVFCLSNWALEIYQTRLNLSSAKKSFREKEMTYYGYAKPEKRSSAFSGRAIYEDLEYEMKEKFASGDFGGNEENYMTILCGELNEFFSDQMTGGTRTGFSEKSYFRTDPEYCLRLLELEGCAGIVLNKNQLASLIKRTDDRSLLVPLVHTAGEVAFDPEGTLLGALETVVKKSGKNDKKLLQEIADATYSICRFMGRPLFFRRGHEILNYMLYPQFDRETKDYALKTLDKVIEAEF